MTEEQVNTIIAMWAKGETSEAIAKHIGKTRNAILGKVFRLRAAGVEMAVRGKTGGKKSAESRKRQQPSPPPRLRYHATGQITIRRTKEMVRPRPSAGMFFDRRKPSQCAYIAGDPRDKNVLCCGDEVAPGKSYCAGHYAICYYPSRTGATQ